MVTAANTQKGDRTLTHSILSKSVGDLLSGNKQV